MQFVVTVEPGDYDEQGEPIILDADIEKQVVAAATARLVECVNKHIAEELKRQVEKQVEPWVAAALRKPVQHTDQWGNPIGDPIGFEERVSQITRQFLGEMVNRDGDNIHYTTGVPVCARAEWIVRRHADKMIREEIAAYLTEHRKQLAKGLSDVVAASATAISSRPLADVEGS